MSWEHWRDPLTGHWSLVKEVTWNSRRQMTQRRREVIPTDSISPGKVLSSLSGFAGEKENQSSLTPGHQNTR